MEFVISPQEEGEDFQPQPQSIQFYIYIYISSGLSEVGENVKKYETYYFYLKCN